jgi:hypothetical protein
MGNINCCELNINCCEVEQGSQSHHDSGQMPGFEDFCPDFDKSPVFPGFHDLDKIISFFDKIYLFVAGLSCSCLQAVMRKLDKKMSISDIEL